MKNIELYKEIAKKFMDFKAEAISEYAPRQARYYNDPEVISYTHERPNVLVQLTFNILSWAFANAADDSDLCPYCIEFVESECMDCPWSKQHGDCHFNHSVYQQTIRRFPITNEYTYEERHMDIFRILYMSEHAEQFKKYLVSAMSAYDVVLMTAQSMVFRYDVAYKTIPTYADTTPEITEHNMTMLPFWPHFSADIESILPTMHPGHSPVPDKILAQALNEAGYRFKRRQRRQDYA